MSEVDENLQQRVRQLVDAYRGQCLWFLREDYYPDDMESTVRVLDYIRRYGDREAFQKASVLCSCLLPHSKGPSAVS